MKAAARKALEKIQDCVSAGRYRLLSHFVQRMEDRGLFWADIQAVLDLAQAVEDDGLDKFGRPKWRVRGTTTDRLNLEIVCVLGRDERGQLAVVITAYWN